MRRFLFLALIALAGCASAPANPYPDGPAACRSLASATRLVSGPDGFTMQAQAAVEAEGDAKVPPALRADIAAVYKLSLSSPPPPAVARLDAACRALGVRGPFS